MLILFSSDSKGVCFIETKNLDGETNLKHKSANKEIQREIKTEKGVEKSDFVLSYEKPNPYLYTFSGTVILKDGTRIACDNQNFVLRGCSLRNTDFIYGLIAYSGYRSLLLYFLILIYELDMILKLCLTQ
jgi:phospholipid-transporting ATPase